MFLQDNLLQFNHISMGTQASHSLNLSQIVHLINADEENISDKTNVSTLHNLFLQFHYILK